MTQVADAYAHLLEKPRESVRVPDFLLGVTFPIPVVLPFINISANMVALAGAVGLASLRRPEPQDRLPLWAPAILGAMVLWLGLSLFYNGLDNYVQWAFFATWASSVWAFASGRLDRVSLCRGVGLGLAVGAVAGLASRFAGIGSDNYTGRLTGSVWGDPNQAGYFLAVLTAVTMVGLRPGWRRWGALLVFTSCIALTLSRTSVVAIAVAGIWFLIRRRVSPVLGILVASGLGYGLLQLSQQLKYWGPFADRAGSDTLRERIDTSASALIETHPWIGRGPGTAQVDVDGRLFFFHNAYLSVRNNGGWILLGLLLLLIALVTLKLLRLPPEQHHPWHEASLIALLICAGSLGEAFLRAPAALAIGLALRHAINPFELRRSDADETPDHVL